MVLETWALQIWWQRWDPLASPSLYDVGKDLVGSGILSLSIPTFVRRRYRLVGKDVLLPSSFRFTLQLGLQVGGEIWVQDRVTYE